MAIDLIQWMMFCSRRCGARRLRHVQRRPGVGGPGADVQEQRAVRLEHARGRRHPGAGPFQIVGLARGVSW